MERVCCSLTFISPCFKCCISFCFSVFDSPCFQTTTSFMVFLHLYCSKCSLFSNSSDMYVCLSVHFSVLQVFRSEHGRFPSLDRFEDVSSLLALRDRLCKEQGIPPSDITDDLLRYGHSLLFFSLCFLPVVLRSHPVCLRYHRRFAQHLGSLCSLCASFPFCISLFS